MRVPRPVRTMLSVLLGLALVAGLVTLVGCSSDGMGGESSGAAQATVSADDPFASGTHHVRIVVRDYGTIEAELYADRAPQTVANFCHLAQDGFYDGLTFHRVVPGFMIQGGDPTGDGTGGSDQTIPGEFSANGFSNTLSHARGVISMARSNDYDSASSQFFIMQEATPSLDGQYAAFGRVTSGMEVVDAICEQVPVADDATGLVAPEDQPVIERVEVVD